MMRLAVLSVTLSIAAGASAGLAQDPDEVKRLKERIELLEAKLELAKRDNEALRAENERLKAAAKGDALPKGGEKSDAGKLFVKDAVWAAGEPGAGIRLVVQERTGGVFKGVITFGKETFNCRGEVDGDRVRLETLRRDGSKFYRRFDGKVDGTVWKFSVSGTKADGTPVGTGTNELRLSDK